MKATILDTVTGLTAIVNGPRSYEYADNGWSCDCNRNPWDVDTGKPDDLCERCERFLVIAAEFGPEDYQYTLRELNDGYPEELLEKYLPR